MLIYKQVIYAQLFNIFLTIILFYVQKKIKGDKQGSHSSHFTNEIDI